MQLGAAILPLDINNTEKYTEASETGVKNTHSFETKMEYLMVIVNLTLRELLS